MRHMVVLEAVLRMVASGVIADMKGPAASLVPVENDPKANTGGAQLVVGRGFRPISLRPPPQPVLAAIYRPEC